MLRLSKLTDYAIVISTHMARHADSTYAAAEVAEATGIAVPTVKKLLKLLAKTGIVSSVRGSRGGYRLAHAPEKTTVANIIAALEGPIGLTECSITSINCQQAPSCGIRGNWSLISRALQTALESVTLADMVRPVANQMEEVRIPVQSIYSGQHR